MRLHAAGVGHFDHINTCAQLPVEHNCRIECLFNRIHARCNLATRCIEHAQLKFTLLSIAQY